ncbi:FAD-dependent protein [Oscillospiraceae bacterium 38-13]
MLKLEGLRLPPGGGDAEFRAQAARLLRLRPEDIRELQVLRRSVDARENVSMIYSLAVTVDNEVSVLRRCRNKKVSRLTPEPDYIIPVPESPRPPEIRPVVVGAGPAGLFAALVLALAGQNPILLERGRPVEARKADVEHFWSTGELDLSSNVQFGEGGAGAFSDGKLNTGTKDPRHRYILRTLAAAGAPQDILIDAKPHIGTDYLYITLQNLRNTLLSLGTDIRFETRLTDLRIENGALAGILTEGPEGPCEMPCKNLILSPGHSARDTFETLYRRGVHMEAKPFAVGLRIEHLQADCDAAQYREFAGHPGLPASSYKLSCHLPSGRGVFSFCVCPGGEVVAAASEPEQVVTNGMSEFARDKANINGAILVGVTPEDFGSSPLAGVEFQRRLEAAAYALGGGGYRAPAQRVEDFLARRPSVGPGRVTPSYRPGVTWTNLHKCLSPFVSAALEEALPILGRKLRGYDAPDAVLTAVESRSSSPVRIPRDSEGQANIRGLYPCGEGAGYAGGILSAAADGMRCAEAVLRNR